MGKHKKNKSDSSEIPWEDDSSHSDHENKLHRKNKKSEINPKSSNKDFSKLIIMNAIDDEWEDHEIARLVNIISISIKFDETQLFNFLLDCEIGNPILIASLMDFGYTFSTKHIIHLLDSVSESSGFPSRLNEALEQVLLYFY